MTLEFWLWKQRTEETLKAIFSFNTIGYIRRCKELLFPLKALHSRSRVERDREAKLDHVTSDISLPGLVSQDESHDQKTKPEALSTEDTEVEDVDYLMQKMSYWRRLRQASRKLNKYTRNVTQMSEHPRTEVRVYVCSTPGEK